MPAEAAGLAAALLAHAGVDLAPTGGLLEPAVALAMALDHPAYDCLYIALAAARGCDVVTADELLVRKATAAGLATRVVSLHAAPVS